MNPNLDEPSRRRCELCDRLSCWPVDEAAEDAAEWRTTGSPWDEPRTARPRRRPRTARRTECAASVVRWRALMPMLLLLMFALLAGARADDFDEALKATTLAPGVLPNPNAGGSSVTKNKVCQSMDFRNDVKELERLRGCRVIEGFVHIVLMPDTVTAEKWETYQFPDLVEITDHLLFFRVPGLKSIGQLFPNLAVIRGNTLFTNYALVAFENVNLQEVGLYSLTKIMRGSIRLSNNPRLCYTDTIDWDAIVEPGVQLEFVANKMKNECPVCEKDCPENRQKPGERLCWNNKVCQKVCNCGPNRACMNNGTCCHESCLGDCTGETARDCKVCRDVEVDDTMCAFKCPDNTFEFMSRRCVTERQCRMQQKPKEMKDPIKRYPYKPFGKKCLVDCPHGYMEVDNEGILSCQRCVGQCLKECVSNTVTSVETAQQLRGCTYIKNNLEINIGHTDQNVGVVRELEASLQDIIVIEGYLKVFRSLPLVSLNFLKNLTEIRGSTLENGDYSVVVIDNLNLQQLWNWTDRKPLKIGTHKPGKAKILFHYNPKLCMEEIELLRQKTGLDSFTESDVSKLTNGDKVACNLTELQTKVYIVGPRIAVIRWKKFEHHDNRKIIGYVIYYKEAPFQNVTMYESREAGSGDDWITVDVPFSRLEEQNKTEEYYSYTVEEKVKQSQPEYKENTILNNLKPFTQYVYYIKTYAISMENLGALSKLVYFKTLPGTPSSPRFLNIYPNSSNSLVISWMEPAEPNGHIAYYKITGKFEPYDKSLLAERNYCEEPMLPMTHKTIMEMAEEKRKQAELEMTLAKRKEEAKAEDDVCSNRKKHVDTVNEALINAGIAFEDALHNQIYVKRPGSSSRRKRHLNDTVHLDPGSSSEDGDDHDIIYHINEKVPATSLTFVAKRLKHFGKYNLQVSACLESNVTTEKPCSTDAMKSEQTFRKEKADDILSSTFKLLKSTNNESLTTIKLQWEEPEDPNGIVLTYQVEYKRVDQTNFRPQIICVTALNFKAQGKTLILDKLASGNYSVRVRATTFAGDGAYTEARYFDIPESGFSWSLFLFFTSIVFLCGLGGCGFYAYRLKKAEREAPNMRLIATVNPEYISCNVYKQDEWEFPRDQIEIVKELGSGSFGMVYEGIAKNIKEKPEVRCALKTVNDKASMKERDEFLNEASVMKAFNTHHVVKLLGVVSIGQPSYVIMELMTNGDLKSYLRSHRPDTCENMTQNPPTLKRIIKMAIEIADGMAYLANKKYVHRDLAARNCMVAEDLTVKIGDFGMTRDIYQADYYRKGTKGLLPVRWMAPESLKDGVYASSSDVWSYGIVLWEMITLASQPYQGLSNDQVLHYIINGGVMEKPEHCPDSLYELMRYTWHTKHERRPTFIDIIEMLLIEIDVEPFEKVSFYHSPEGVEARNQNNPFYPYEKSLALDMLQDLREEEEEEEPEGQEDSPLRQSFGDDFSSFEPTAIGIKNGSTAPFIENYKNTPKKTLDLLDLDSSKIPLKAGFDDFDGVSADSLASSKDTLNLPFAEDSVKSVKNSPFAQKKSNSRGNISQGSVGRSSLSPQSPSILAPSGNSGTGSRGSPSVLSTGRSDPEYENRSPLFIGSQPHDVVSYRVSFPTIDAIDSDSTVIIMGKDSNSPSPRTPTHTDSNNTSAAITTTQSNKQQYLNKSPGDSQQSPAMNNGYIGGAAAT